jgi:hypothetical protein
MAVPFTAGQRILAADLNTATQQGAWTSYGVTWTSTGTAPAVGNGALVGYYGKVGRVVTVKISLTSGSTTTYGTGVYIFSLPFAAATTGVPSAGIPQMGGWSMGNNGNGLFYGGPAAVQQGAPNQVIGFVNASANFMGATNPTTLSGAGSFITITMTYESTS